MNKTIIAITFIVFYFSMYHKILSKNLFCVFQSDLFNFSNVYLLPYKTNIAPF